MPTVLSNDETGIWTWSQQKTVTVQKVHRRTIEPENHTLSIIPDKIIYNSAGPRCWPEFTITRSLPHQICHDKIVIYVITSKSFQASLFQTYFGPSHIILP